MKRHDLFMCFQCGGVGGVPLAAVADASAEVRGMVRRHRRVCLKIPRVYRNDAGEWVVQFTAANSVYYLWDLAIVAALSGPVS